MHILKRTDIDPILYCQLVDMCKVLDCTGECANITEMVATPQEGQEGTVQKRQECLPPLTRALVDTHFMINCAFNVTQPAGAGMLRFQIYPSASPNDFDSADCKHRVCCSD